ncbi:unnamed protein product, partial [Ectocarpus sp. 6 AP-2014]
IATAALGATAEHAPGPSVPSLHATEAEHRQRVFEKQRELEAKQKKQERGEAKRRREQELAIWKEQREEAKQRKGGGGGKGPAVQTSPGEGKAVGGDADRADQGRVGASLGAPAELRGKELHLRCPFPPPGRAIAGDELDSSTVESVGLFPRGRLMVQFSDGATIKQGEGAMPSAGNDQAGGGGGGGGGEPDGGGGDDGGGGHRGGGGSGGPAARKSRVEVGTLQDILMDNICQRIRGGGQHQAVSYGGLDAVTGTRILQRLADLRALTPAMLSAFRGCPVAELSLDRNPRVTNALLAELGRKVSIMSLSLAHNDAMTLEGIESLAGLRALASLDISGCKVTNGWLKVIAKLPALETLVLRGCTKVADLGILGLSRGAPSLTCLDLAGCTGVTDAGVAHLSSMVVGGKLECLRLDGLVGLSDDGLDALLLGDGDGLGAAAAAAAAVPAASAARAAAARAATARASSSLSDGGGEEEAPASSSLRVLSLSRCPGVADQGLARLGASRALRASLRELDVSGTSATESGLVRLLDPSSAAAAAASGEAGGGGAVVGRRRPAPLRLESLVLQHGGGGITSVGLSALVGLTSLTRLDLEGCRGSGVTSQALAGLARLVRLQWLSVAAVPAFDDDALTAVCSSCNALRVLNLGSTSVARAAGLALLGSAMIDLSLAHTNIDDDTMDAVASLPRLTTLTLRGTAVTGAGVARLSGLRGLRSLVLTGTRAAQEGGAGGGASSAVERLRARTAALNIRL